MYFTDEDTDQLAQTTGDLQTDFGENLDAAWEATKRNRLSISKGYYSDQYKDELVDQQATRMRELGYDIPDSVIEGAKLDRQADWNNHVEKAQKLFPGETFNRYIDLYKMGMAKARDEAIRTREEHEDVSSRATGTGTAGGFIGEATASMVLDPVNVGVTALTLPFTPARLAGQVAINTVTNTAAETAIQYGSVKDWLIEQGVSEEEADRQARYSVAMGAAGAAGLTVGLNLAGRGAGALFKKMNGGGTPARNTLDELDSQRQNLTPDERQWLDDSRQVLDNQDNVQYGTSGVVDEVDQIQVHSNQSRMQDIDEIFEFNTTPRQAIESAETVASRMANLEDMYQASRNGFDVFDSLAQTITPAQRRVLDDLAEDYAFKSTDDMSPALKEYLNKRSTFDPKEFFEHDRNQLRNMYRNLDDADKARLNDGDIPSLKDARANAASDMAKALKKADENKLKYLRLYATNPHIQPAEMRNILELDSLRQHGDYDLEEVFDFIPLTKREKYRGIDNPRTLLNRYLNDTIKEHNVKGKKVIKAISTSLRDLENELKSEGLIDFNRIHLRQERPVTQHAPVEDVNTPRINNAEQNPTVNFGDDLDRVLAQIEEGNDVHIDGFDDIIRSRSTLLDDNGIERSVDDYMDEIKAKEQEAKVLEGCMVW